MLPPLTDHPMPIFTAASLRHAIRRRHARYYNVIWIDELRTKAGMDGGERYIDLWGIRCNVPDCTAFSYEIKVSRGDFLRDMKIAAKHDGARALSNEFTSSRRQTSSSAKRCRPGRAFWSRRPN
jgi:hypothetical protein